METKKTTILGNGLIWFGASISIAELMTGTALAPLGFGKAAAAIILGHVIGCVLLYAAGLIGAKRGVSAMESVRISFGKYGAVFFALLNVCQLIGWTAVMTRQGADSAAAATGMSGVIGNADVWAVVIGIFILIWILIGITNISKLNVVVMALLFLLTVVLSYVVFGKGGINVSGALAGDLAASDALSFGAAVELSAAMPISWLPLISDYTRTAEKPEAATVVSVIVYFAGSCWMFMIGMSAALFTGSSSIAGIMLAAGFGITGLLIVVISTVTTTFLDAYSAGVSSVSIYGRINEKAAAAVVAVVGTALAVFAPVSEFESFLYLIGSVFSPMIAILITDVFLLRRDKSQKLADVRNIILWVAGFIIYRAFMYVDTPVGTTLPVIVIIMLLCIAAEFVCQFINLNREKSNAKRNRKNEDSEFTSESETVGNEEDIEK